MSDQTVAPETAETPKVRRGGRPKGSKNKSVKMVGSGLSELANQGKVIEGEALDRFQYQANSADLDFWEGNEKITAMHVPEEIKKAYPDLDFHWSSQAKWDKMGKNWKGWQVFKDATLCPDGVRRGNDVFLTAMPKERAQRLRDATAFESTKKIIGLQEQMLESKIGDNLTEKELKELGASGEPGINIGDRPKTMTRFGNRVIAGGGYNRGMSRKEVHQRMADVRREAADRAKRRVYSFPKG